MKKFIMIFITIVIVILALIYGYFTYNDNIKTIKQENATYEEYYQKEIYGADLATVINKAINSNETNYIEKDNKGAYIENNTNSIKIDIHILDNDTTYNMETFYNNGIDKFVENYNIIQFKCTSIEYHSETGKIKYMLFEQITT